MCFFVDCSVQIGEARCSNKRRQHLRRVHPDKDITTAARKQHNKRQKALRLEALSHDSVDEKDKRIRALGIARRAYWRDKPFEMDDDELMKEVKRSEVKAEDIARMVREYNEQLGPGVGTCVCALCNDFCTENEGEFAGYTEKPEKFEAKYLLEKIYKVGCTTDQWNKLSSLEQRFRHIVDVNEGKGKAKEPDRYFISAHGLQSRDVKSKKWTWWTDGATSDYDLSTARFFVCHACDKPRSGHKRWLVNSDPGRIPEDLKKIPLNMAEKIVLNEAVIFNNTVLLDVVKKNHLSGHVISIEVNRRDNQPAPLLPRKEYSEYIQLAFFGEGGMRPLAFKLMRTQKWEFTVVRPEVVHAWMEGLEMVDALQRFLDNREDYIRTWKQQADLIRAGAIDTDNKAACEMRRRGLADVARARPQFDADEDDTQHADAAPGISHIFLRHQDNGAQAHDFLRSVRKVVTPADEESQQEALTLDEDLQNEFTNNDGIIYGSFRHLLPLGNKSKLIGVGSVPEVVSRRLMRFNDPRFAQDAPFRNFLFSQQMRHGVCRRMAKLRKNKKLDGLNELIKEDGFHERLKRACVSEYTASLPDAKALIDKLMPYFRDTSGALKWSTLERQGSKSEMFAMTLTYGAGGYFFTVSPAMKNQRLAIRMMKRLRVNSGKDTWDSASFPTDKQREKLCAANPVESARVYDMLARAFYSRLVCSGLSNGPSGYRNSKFMKQDRSKGAFGYTNGVYGVTEAQHNGSLHTHGIGFQSVLGMALRRFAGVKGKTGKQNLQKVCDAIDSHISAAMDGATRKKNRELRNWIDGTTPVPPKRNWVDACNNKRVDACKKFREALEEDNAGESDPRDRGNHIMLKRGRTKATKNRSELGKLKSRGQAQVWNKRRTHKNHRSASGAWGR